MKDDSNKKPQNTPKREPIKRTPLAPDAPAPATDALVAAHGKTLSAAALQAWNARVQGVPIIDLAHRMGMTIKDARQLIGEAHAAIAEDLKQNLDLNRQLDLERLDGLISTYYPAACRGDTKSADIALKLLQHRAKLTGVEPMPEPRRDHAGDVLIWIQAQLPSIKKIVDALPLD